MKTFFHSLKYLALFALLLFGSVVTGSAQVAKLQLDQLDALAGRASETLDLKLDERLMITTAKLFSGKGKDDAEIKEMLKGIKGIYAKHFSFEKEGQYASTEIDSVLSQLKTSGWSKILGVTSKKEGQNVDVYINLAGDQINGLAVISLEPKELTVVNIVGPVDLEKLGKLEGNFGVPELDLEKEPIKKKN